MPLINDDHLYSLDKPDDQDTWVGHDKQTGKTKQFTMAGVRDKISREGDIVLAEKSTKAGQIVIGNIPDLSAEIFPEINNGKPFLGAVKRFPFTTKEDIFLIVRLA